jgi:F-type H+-transporting ATPase subunit delta
MTNRTAATRYARALLDVAIKEADRAAVNDVLRRIEEQLAAFAGLLEQYPELQRALLNPAIPAPRKRAAVAELTARGNVTPVLAKLLVLLAQRDRLVLLPDLLAAYRERLLQYLKVVRAEVTTAVELPAERAKAVEQRLAGMTGRTVTLATRVDPSIVGGVIARIGSTVYDGSITRQLEKMKQQLVEGV